ncbi:MAG: DUF2490 domain-containing protein [Bacteroidia bacterium]|nr:DUF2490 domain-containing protein [Bacteroidia bacterium]
MRKQERHIKTSFLRAGLLLAGIFFCGILPAQSRLLENGQWFGASISQDIKKDFKWSYEQDLRFRYGMYIVDNYFNELGVDYKLHKYLTVKFKYRIGFDDINIRPRFYQRFNLDFKTDYRWKKASLTFTWRPRIQVRLRPGEGQMQQSWHLRNKLDISYKLNKKFDFWWSGELFHRLNEPGRNPFADELRNYLGVDVDLGKRKEISLYYMNSYEMHVEDPYTTHVLGAQFNYELKKISGKKKKKKKKKKASTSN